jgi:arabinogalactan endo-1,4-beta-galactosidase
MKKAGWNFVRFRVWNAPKDGYCDKARTLALARRAKAQGLAISLDFHYSDWWADPGKQYKPAAWKDLSFDDLTKALYDYTRDVVSAMVAQGTRPVMVQIGNEIVNGLLWPDGRVDSNSPDQWKHLAALLNAGIRAVHDAEGNVRIKTMIHLDRGGDNARSVWWFDHIDAEHVPFDLIGQSYYPFWHGPIDKMEANLTDLAKRYKKDIYIVETAYPWKVDTSEGPRVYSGAGLQSGYPPTPEGQAAFLEKLISILHGLPGGHGKGLLYWAPTWIPYGGKHGDYNNMATFDGEGRALPAVDVLGSKR